MHDDRRHYRSRSRGRDYDRDRRPYDEDRSDRYRSRNDYDRSPRRSRSPRYRDSSQDRHREDDHHDGDRYKAQHRSYGGQAEDDYAGRNARDGSKNGSSMYDDDTSRRSDRRDAPQWPLHATATILVDGLPNDVVADDVVEGLKDASPSSVFRADSVKEVRLRTTRHGQRLASVEFYDVDDAVSFLQHHGSTVELHLQHFTSKREGPFVVSIKYEQDRAPRRDDPTRDGAEWVCYECGFSNYDTRRQCLKCNTRRDDSYRQNYIASLTGPLLNGETDEDPLQTPSQYLVIRNLEGNMTEEIFAEGVKKLYAEVQPLAQKGEKGNKLRSTAPTANAARMGAQPGTLRRVFLMRDSNTDTTMRYGFAEFATVEDAQRAVAKFQASASFSISTRPATVSFIHNGVFVPLTEADKRRLDDDRQRFAFQPIYNPDVWLKYWDGRVYPSILWTDAGETSGPTTATKQTSVTDAPEADEARKAKKPKTAPSTTKTTITLNPQMQMWAKKAAELGQALAGTELAEASAMDIDSTPAKPRPGLKRPRVRASYTSFADLDSMACLLCLRKFKSEEELRNHEVLSKTHSAKRADEEARNAATKRLGAKGKKAEIITLRVSRTTATSDASQIYISYADKEDLQCLLCQRRFSKPSMLSLHERESELHRRNLADQANIDRAISTLASRGKTPRKMVPKSRNAPQYRDRARERRKIFGASTHRRRAADGPAIEGSKSDDVPVSKGAALLGKMGWTAGAGLGASGEGRTEAIASEMYVAGVGLGAEGGKLGDAAAEAARKTKDSYSDFLEQTRDKARQRLEQMGPS